MISTFPRAYSRAELLRNPLYTYNGRQYFQYTRLSKNNATVFVRVFISTPPANVFNGTVLSILIQWPLVSEVSLNFCCISYLESICDFVVSIRILCSAIALQAIHKVPFYLREYCRPLSKYSFYGLKLKHHDDQIWVPYVFETGTG